jgi:hypothetical protein
MRVVRVQDIVLDESHFHFDGEDSMGTIIYTELNDSTPRDNNFTNCKAARPLFYNMITGYPVPNELVHVISAPSFAHNDFGNMVEYYFPPIAVHKSPTSNALPNAVTDKGTYFEGTYFKENINIRPLRVYEGDIVIEGRFGNSLRFGSTIDNKKTLFPNYWSNRGKIGNPITIIRNGQNPGTQSPDNAIGPRMPYVHILEDIQNDDASVALCSNQQITNFMPASIHMGSYGLIKKEEQQKTEEVERGDENMPNNVTEDVELQQATPLPAEEIRQIEESTLPVSASIDTVTYDIAPTSDTAIFPETDVPLSSLSSSTSAPRS